MIKDYLQYLKTDSKELKKICGLFLIIGFVISLIITYFFSWTIIKIDGGLIDKIISSLLISMIFSIFFLGFPMVGKFFEFRQIQKLLTIGSIKELTNFGFTHKEVDKQGIWPRNKVLVGKINNYTIVFSPDISDGKFVEFETAVYWKNFNKKLMLDLERKYKSERIVLSFNGIGKKLKILDLKKMNGLQLFETLENFCEILKLEDINPKEIIFD